MIYTAASFGALDQLAFCLSTLEQQVDDLLLFCLSLKPNAKPAGLGLPADVLLPGGKSTQKRLLLAEGIFLCMVSVDSIDFCIRDPALFKGPLCSAFLQPKAKAMPSDS